MTRKARLTLPVLLLAAAALTGPSQAVAAEPDSDRDGLSDGYEIGVAHSDPFSGPSTAGHLIDPATGLATAPLAPGARTAAANTVAAPRPPDLYVSPAGSDAAACTRTAPCRSLAHGYAYAKEGDVVEVGAGWYGPQVLPPGSKAVTFRGGSEVRLRQLISDASNVTFDGIEVDAGGVKTNMAAVELRGPGSTFKNARVGNVVDEKGLLVTGANQTIDNVEFHDAVLKTPGYHMECAYAIGAPGLTVRNSTFHDCAVMDLFVTYGDWWQPQPPAYGDVTLENNVFSHPEQLNNQGWHTCCGLYVGSIGPKGARDPLTGWTVRNNTFEGTAFVTPARGAGGTRWVGNLGDWVCKPGITYRHNVGSSCSDSDRKVVPSSSSPGTVAALGWVDPADQDFRLAQDSPAIGGADPADSPLSDRSGAPRDGRPDAGAYESG